MLFRSLGCGDGLFLSMIDKKFKRFGVDISSVAIAKLNEKGIEGEAFDFTEAALPFADGSFATVVSLDVLEHLFYPERLLKEALRVTSAAVVIGVPNFSSLPARIAVVLGKVPENNRPQKGHCYWFNLQTLRSVVKTAGGTITEIHVNTFWQQRAILGSLMKFLAQLFPSLFALSFVVKIHKV